MLAPNTFIRNYVERASESLENAKYKMHWMTQRHNDIDQHHQELTDERDSLKKKVKELQKENETLKRPAGNDHEHTRKRTREH